MTRDISRADALKLIQGKGRKRKKPSGATTAAAPSGDLRLYSLEFFIPGMMTQSLNTTLREGPRQHHADKKRWYNVLHGPLSYLVNGECKLYRWRIAFTRYGAKELDYTNLVGGMKPLEDSIRDLGLIYDDDPDSIEMVVNQVVSKPPDRGMLIKCDRLDLLNQTQP